MTIDFELGRRHVQPLGAVLAHDMHGAATARASRALRLDDDFFPRQMGRQFAAIDRAGLLGRRFQRRVRGLLCGARFSDRLLGLLHGEVQLIGIELFGFAAELRAPQLAQRLPQSCIGVLHAGQFGVFFAASVVRRRLFRPVKDQRLQGADIVRERL